MFGKSAVAIHSLIMRATEVDLSVYVGRNLAAICRSRCYNRRYKRALDRVEEIENKINKISHMMARSESKGSLKSQDKSQRLKKS